MFLLAILVGGLLPSASDSLPLSPPPLSAPAPDRDVPSEPVVDLPVGETVGDPVPGPFPVATSDRIDSLHFVIHGALEGSKTLTAGDSLVYVGADWLRDHVLHNRTRTSAIESRLLFRKGDALDTSRLQETERTLRAERFIAEASVRPRRAADGRRVVDVETWDQWSTAVPLMLNRAGGELTWLVGFSEANLLGSGQEVGFTYLDRPRQSAWTTTYANNAFFSPGRTLSLSWATTSDGHVGKAKLGRPLAGRFQEWAWMAEYEDARFDRTVDLGRDVWQELRTRHPAQDADDWGAGPSGIEMEHLSGSATLGIASGDPFLLYGGTQTRRLRLWTQKVWGDRIQVSSGPLVEWVFDSTGIPLAPSTIPASLLQELKTSPRWAALREGPPEIDDRRAGWMTTLRQERWVRRKNFNNFKWSEDIPLGWALETQATHAFVSRGEDRNGTWLLASGRWSHLQDNTYATLSGGWQRRAGGSGPYPDRQQLGWKAELRHFASPVLQEILSASFDVQLDAPPTSPLTLGEENGLPGFPARSFAGDRRDLFGAELRWIPPIEALTIMPALATFAAIGRTDASAEALDAPGQGDWHAGAGFGFRFGLTRSINSVVNHLSFSRPLGPEGGDWPDLDCWMVSFGSKASL